MYLWETSSNLEIYFYVDDENQMYFVNNKLKLGIETTLKFIISNMDIVQCLEKNMIGQKNISEKKFRRLSQNK